MRSRNELIIEKQNTEYDAIAKQKGKPNEKDYFKLVTAIPGNVRK